MIYSQATSKSDSSVAASWAMCGTSMLQELCMHKLAEFNSNGIQHMHISRRLLHTTLYIQPPKLILTGRFVVKKKNILALWTKPESTMYTLDRLTWDDTVKVSVILLDGQTATLVCHRSRPPPPTTNLALSPGPTQILSHSRGKKKTAGR